MQRNNDARIHLITALAIITTTATAYAGLGPRYEVVSRVQVLRCGRVTAGAVPYLTRSPNDSLRITEADWRDRLGNGVVIQGHQLATREVTWSLMPLVTGRDEPPEVTPWQSRAAKRSLETFFYTGARQCSDLRHGQVLILASWAGGCDACSDPFDWSRFLHPVPTDTSEVLKNADSKSVSVR
jgi:hypothetical protein